MTQMRDGSARLEKGTTWSNGGMRRIGAGLAGITGLLGVIMVLAAGRSGAAPAGQPTASSSATIAWDGKRGADQIPSCDDGQRALYHWILTAPGGITSVSGTLTVSYEGGATTTTEGGFAGQSDNGAMQFWVQVTPNDVPVSATADVTYTGSGDTGKIVLTISHAECGGSHTTTPPATTPPATTTPATTTPPATTATPPATTPASETESQPPSHGIRAHHAQRASSSTSSGSATAPIPAGVDAGLTTPIANAGLRSWGAVLLIIAGTTGLAAGIWPTRRRAH